MTIMVAISDAAKASADALVSSGRFETVEQAIEASLNIVKEGWIDEEVDLDDLSPDVRAKVEAGLAAADAGDVIDGETFFKELRAKYQAMIAHK